MVHYYFSCTSSSSKPLTLVVPSDNITDAYKLAQNYTNNKFVENCKLCLINIDETNSGIIKNNYTPSEN
jgi:hypothetical protein